MLLLREDCNSRTRLPLQNVSFLYRRANSSLRKCFCEICINYTVTLTRISAIRAEIGSQQSPARCATSIRASCTLTMYTIRVRTGSNDSFLIFPWHAAGKSAGISWELIEMKGHEAVAPWQSLRSRWLVAMTTRRVVLCLLWRSWGRLQGHVSSAFHIVNFYVSFRTN